MAEAFRAVAAMAVGLAIACAGRAAAHQPSGQAIAGKAPLGQSGRSVLSPTTPSIRAMTGYPAKRSVYAEQQMRGYTGSGKPVQADASDEVGRGVSATLSDDLAKPLQRERPRVIMQVDHHGATWAYDNEHGVWRNLTTGLTQLRPPPS